MLATTETTIMSFSEVSSLLWQEREALELLLFKLVEERLIVSAGETRWLAAANDEVEAAVDRLQGIELMRAAEVESLAASLGRGPAPTLDDLAGLAGEPWSSILRDHREALLTVVLQIEQATDENRRLLSAAARSVRETLLSLYDAPVDTYDARGVTSAGPIRPMIMDEQA
jgi:hypothetical protein